MLNRTAPMVCAVISVLSLCACGDDAHTPREQIATPQAVLPEDINVLHEDDGVEALVSTDPAAMQLRFFDVRDLATDEAAMTVLEEGVRKLVRSEGTVTQQNQILIVRAQAKELSAIEAHLGTRRRTQPDQPKRKRAWTPIREK